MDRRHFILLGTAGSVAVLTGCGSGGGEVAAMPPTGTVPPPADPGSSRFRCNNGVRFLIVRIHIGEHAPVMQEASRSIVRMDCFSLVFKQF